MVDVQLHKVININYLVQEYHFSMWFFLTTIKQMDHIFVLKQLDLIFNSHRIYKV